MDITLPDDLLTNALGALLRIGAAVLVLVAGRWLARRSRRWLAHGLQRVTLTPSLEALLHTVTYAAVWILTIMAALIVLGVPVTTVLLVAVLALLVVGVALQQSLRDLAAGVNFILFKPFVVGDMIETKGFLGTVEEVQLFNTVLVLRDLKVVTMPNHQVQTSGITNYSKKGVLRTDVTFRISYGDDIAAARRIIQEVLAADARVLPDPPLRIWVKELAESSVHLRVRAAVAPANYFALQYELQERVKLRFDQEGITIPFEQQTVHLVQAPAPPT